MDKAFLSYFSSGSQKFTCLCSSVTQTSQSSSIVKTSSTAEVHEDLAFLLVFYIATRILAGMHICALMHSWSRLVLHCLYKTLSPATSHGRHLSLDTILVSLLSTWSSCLTTPRSEHTCKLFQQATHASLRLNPPVSP